MSRRDAKRLAIDPIACDAHGLCAELLPELIARDDWGYPLLDGRPVPPELKVHARRAVAACPTLALKLAAAEQRARTRAPTGRRP